MQALIKKSHTKRDLLYFCQNPCNKLFELLPYRFWLYNFNLPFKGRQPCEKSFTYSDCRIYDIPTINAYRYYIPETFFCHIIKSLGKNNVTSTFSPENMEKDSFRYALRSKLSYSFFLVIDCFSSHTSSILSIR